MKLAKIASGMAVLLIAAAIVLTLKLDGIVKTSLEQTSGDLLGTEVTVDGVNISLFSGSGTIRNLTIANPEGFEEGPAMTIESIAIELDPLSLLSDPVYVKNVEIRELSLWYQAGLRGSNLGALTGHMNDRADPGGGTGEIIVDRLLMEETRAELRVNIGDLEPVHFTLKRVEQTGISSEDGLEPVLRHIYNVVLAEVEEQARARLIEEGGTRLQNEIENVLKDIF